MIRWISGNHSWLTKVATTSLLLMLVACSGSSKSPKKPTSGSGDAVADPAATDVPCVRGNCPAVSVEVSATGSSGSVLQATIGSRADWSFTATSTQAPSRVFKVFDITASTQPSGMLIDGQKSPSVRVTYTPATGDATSGSLTASVRDMTMCEATAATSTNCNEFSSASGAAYDTTSSLSWQITNATTNSANTTTTGAAGGGGFLQILMQIGMPLIQSMMSGGDMDFSSILGSLGGLFSGGLGGAGGGLGGLTTLAGGLGTNASVVPPAGSTATVPIGTSATGLPTTP